ncbi:MAG: hypothetical protein M1510_14565, partial [Nitrospirae bacterium]|nr:hypothetical protein [Nitrospirota bacterium]
LTSNLKIKEQMDEFLTLFNVGEILNRSDSIDEASNLVLDAVSIGFGAEECAIMVIDGAGRVQMKSFIGMDEGKAEAVRGYMEGISVMSSLQMIEPEKSGEKAGDMTSVGARIENGEILIVPGSRGSLDDFIVVPLKSAKKLLGVITIHRIKGKHIRDIGHIDEIKRLFMVVAMQVSPYFFIGISLDEKRTMKVSPFSCFLELIKGHFEKVREYYGVVSLAVIKVENYNDLCTSMGVDNASLRVQEAGAAISSAIEKVHDATRITEIKLVVILPMIDKMEAAEIIDRAIAGAGSDLILKYKVVSYPEDGETPAQLMFLAYV